MGGGQKIDTRQDLTTSVTLPQATAKETSLLNQLGGLVGPQLDAADQVLRRAIDPLRSPFELDPASKQIVDDARDAAFTRLERQGQDYVDFLAGGRRMRLSDAPVSKPALDTYGQALRDFETQWALQGLNLGLTGNQARQDQTLQAASFMPPALLADLQAARDERFAQATQRSVGHTAGNTTFAPPIPSLLGGAGGALQGVGALSKAGLLGGPVTSALTGGSTGLGAAGLSAAWAPNFLAGTGAGLGGLAAGGGAGLAGLTGTVAPAALAATAPASGLITGGGMAAIAGLGALF